VEQVATGLEEPTKKPQSRFYRPELDVLRFLAFTMVFIDHALPFDGMFTDRRWLGSVRYAGGFGVCLFFMLSSFLITDLLEREHEATGDIHLKAFYVRRVLRIWPLYFAFLFFDFFVQLSRHNGHFPVGKLLAFLLIAGNWYVSRFEVPLTLSSPLWSISVEEQFYLVWPPYRKYVGRLGSIVFAVVTLVLSYVVLAYLCHVQARNFWTNSFLQFQFFSTGALLSFALRGRAPGFSTGARLAFFAGGIAMLLSSPQFLLTRGLTFSNFGGGFLLVNAGCILIFLSFLGESRIGKWRFLTYLGRISYSLYVFHWMFVVAAVHVGRAVASRGLLPPLAARGIMMVVAFAVAIVIASISYHSFEAPILRYKRRFEVVRSRPV
jgi:peptidoglycan/LPS O-acetylase OafA/YrhL